MVRRLHRVTVNNIKRITGADISFDGDETLVVVSGPNGAGKSSFVDAVWIALMGSKALKNRDRVLTEGADTGDITLVIGDGPDELTVTRRYTKGGDDQKLTVTLNGTKAASPQKALDALVGMMTFDPLAFLHLPERQQTTMLVQALGIDIDLDAIDTQRKALYDERTVVGREITRITAALASTPAPPDDTPTEPVSLTALVAELNAANDNNRAIEEIARERDRINADIDDINRRIERLHTELDQLHHRHGDALSRHKRVMDVLAQAEHVDTTNLLARIDGAEATNRDIQLAERRNTAITELDAVTRERDTLTDRIEDIDQTKATALAEANLPDGITFNDDGIILYRGHPLKDCSSAEQIVASAGLAMAGEPEIRLLRIADGSLLDSTSIQAIEHMAQERDFTVFMEVVDESGDIGLVIEDGIVKAPNHA